MGSLRHISKQLPIRAEDWNAIVDEFTRNRPLFVRARRGHGWKHPWSVTLTWNPEKERWEFNIKPGFVNAVAPTFNHLAGDLGRDEEEGLVPLSIMDPARIPIPSPLLQKWGPDATPTGSSFNGRELSLTFKPVPEFFRALGVGDPPVVQGSLADGLADNIDTIAKGIPGDRLLRSIDLYLTQPRTAISLNINVDGAAGAAFGEIGISYTTPEDSTPFLRLAPEYAPQPEVQLSGILLNGESDPGIDTIPIARIWLMSPPDAKRDSEPDITWEPFVQYRTFWNLNHQTQSLPSLDAREPLQFPLAQTLAGGVAGNVVDFILSDLNQQASIVNALLADKGVSGRFWSV